MRSARSLLAFLALLGLAAPGAHAQELSGSKRITLSNSAGERVVIGSVRFTPVGEARWRFEVELDKSKFGEYFLAMRPFRCLAGERQHLCHFPYGEEREITREDLQPLEYALMFMRKKPAVLHLDSRDGIYYRLAWSGGKLGGTLFDVDFDPIVVPKGDRRRPIRHDQLIEADEGTHWLPRLTIE